MGANPDANGLAPKDDRLRFRKAVLGEDRAAVWAFDELEEGTCFGRILILDHRHWVPDALVRT